MTQEAQQALRRTMETYSKVGPEAAGCKGWGAERGQLLVRESSTLASASINRGGVDEPRVVGGGGGAVCRVGSWHEAPDAPASNAMRCDSMYAVRVPVRTCQVTRFCFICNYVSRIIEPLASRCAKFRCAPAAAARQAGRQAELSLRQWLQHAATSGS